MPQRGLLLRVGFEPTKFNLTTFKAHSDSSVDDKTWTIVSSGFPSFVRYLRRCANLKLYNFLMCLSFHDASSVDQVAETTLSLGRLGAGTTQKDTRFPLKSDQERTRRPPLTTRASQHRLLRAITPFTSGIEPENLVTDWMTRFPT